MDVSAERSKYERACNANASHDSMQQGETCAQAVEELHRHEQQCASTNDPMRQQPRLEGFIVLPVRMRRIEKKALVVIQNVKPPWR